MKLPEPHSKEWNELSAEKRKVARWRHNSTSITGTRRQKAEVQKTFKEMN